MLGSVLGGRPQSQPTESELSQEAGRQGRRKQRTVCSGGEDRDLCRTFSEGHKLV